MTINLGFKNSEGIVKYLAQLSINNNRELFFRILWKEKLTPSYYFDALENKEYDITKIDHISFHKDGTAHIRFYNDSNVKEKLKIEKINKGFGDMPQEYYLPLTVLSIYDVTNVSKYIGRDKPLIFDDTPSINFEWEIEKITQFSVVVFLIGSKVHARTMLDNNFPGVFNEYSAPQILNIFGNEDSVEIDNEIVSVNDLGIVIGFTKRIIPKPQKELLIGMNKKKILKKIDSDFIGLRFVTRDDRINSLI